jgi:predicted HicB family RNase H-like nuclease
MNNVMTYKGYSARVEFDDEDGVFFGQIAGIADGIGFHADHVAGLRTAFREAVDDYLATCARLGKEPDKPYSGQSQQSKRSVTAFGDRSAHTKA